MTFSGKRGENETAFKLIFYSSLSKELF